MIPLSGLKNNSNEVNIEDSLSKDIWINDLLVMWFT